MIIPVELGDFSPDLDPSTPGIITDFLCRDNTPDNDSGFSGFIWMNEGIGPGLNISATHTAPFLSATALGGASVTLTGGSNRVFAGTEATLQELSGTAWTDVSRGGGYTTGDNRWRFAAYGDFVYATNKFDLVQKSTGGNFANIATIPKCSFIDRVKDFVIIAGTNEATYGDQPDRWWCSALGNPDDFTPSVATQCVTNRITDTAGPIVASKGLGDMWAIYKANSVYRGIYQGPPFVWEFQCVADKIGTLSQECVVKVGFNHYFVGNDDFYRFDGSVPTPIPNNLKNWFFTRLDRSNAFKTQGYYEPRTSIVFWFYVSQVSGQLTDDFLPNEYVCVNLKNGRWGAGYIPVEAILEYISGGMTYDEFYPPSATTAWDSLPAISYNSPFFLGSEPFMAAILSSDHGLQVFNLNEYAGGRVLSFTLGDYGNDLNYSTLSRVIVKNNIQQVAGSPVFTTLKMCHAGRALLGDSVTFGAFASESESKFYLRSSDRWHRLGFYAPFGFKRFKEIALDLDQDGER